MSLKLSENTEIRYAVCVVEVCDQRLDSSYDRIFGGYYLGLAL